MANEWQPMGEEMLFGQEIKELRRKLDRIRSQRDRAIKALRELTEACEANFCCEGTDDNEPDDSKVSYPEESENITFGMIRRARKVLSAPPEA